MTETEAEKKEKGFYKQVSPLVDRWLELHYKETFDLDMICRQLEIVSREARHAVLQKLEQEIKKKKLEKVNRIYSYIDNTIEYINWQDAPDNNYLDIKFPYGIDDNSCFAFDGHIKISPGDIIVIAGSTNAGKTAFCLNFLWENMDTYQCFIMGNEYTASKFRAKAMKMTWKDPIDVNGKPKFDVAARFDRWKDIIRPGFINIIDWISMEDKFYGVGKIIEDIKRAQGDGITLIAVQKDPFKELGLGGQWGMHLSSLYLTMDYGVLRVKKCKEWNGFDPNNKMYGFMIVDQGTKFHNIRAIKACPRCYGKNPKCPECLGKGYIEAEDRY